jgi:hypothetical protein
MNINIVLLILLSNTSNINNMAKKDFKNSINQTNIPAKSGIQGLFSTTDDLGNSDESTTSLKVKEVTPVISVTLSDLDLKDVRQTFIIRNDYLEKLKDYVHHKRQAGYSFYTQKEALQEALEAFFSLQDVPTRPDFIKEAEQKRANRIKKSL